MNNTHTASPPAMDFSSFVSKAIAVITNPVEFYRTMPRTGGFLEPLVFAVVMGLVETIIQFVLAGVFSVGAGATFAMLFVWPILIAIFSFIGAAILYGIWLIMGSPCSYETAYRCTAYGSAVYPVTAVLSIVPYLGTLISTLWAAYILIVASIEVHGIKPNTAYLVFGGIGLLLVLFGLSAEYGARQLAPQAERLEEQMKNMEDMKPEEAGKALGEFLKGFEKATEDKEAGN